MADIDHQVVNDLITIARGSSSSLTSQQQLAVIAKAILQLSGRHETRGFQGPKLSLGPEPSSNLNKFP